MRAGGVRGQWRRWLLSLAITAAAPAGLSLGGCDDEGSTASPPPSSTKTSANRGRKGKRSGKKDKAGALQVYGKVPDNYRHSFSERDFIPDVTGDENRDPFRSYIVNMPGQRGRDDVVTGGNSICNKDNSVATSYSLRALRLIGIVLRGTKSYALFRDSRSYGHIVRRGDCLGKELARVEAIGAGFVRLMVIPEAPPGAPAPPPQARDVALYPEEIALEPEDEVVEN
jgi:hypothetical protein